MIWGWARRHFANPLTGLSDPLNHLTDVLRSVSIVQITPLPSLSHCEASVSNGVLRQDFATNHGNPERNLWVIPGAHAWDNGNHNRRTYNRGCCQFSDKVRQSQNWNEVRNVWNEYSGRRNSWAAEVVLLRCKSLPNVQDGDFLDEVLELMIRELKGRATPRQVVGALHSLAKIGYTNCDLLDQFVRGIADRGFGTLFTRRDIAILTYALGTIESFLGSGSVPSSKRLIDQMAAQIVSYLDHSQWHRGEFELANLLTGLGQLRIKHGRIISAVKRLVSDEERLGKLRPYGLVEMLYRTSQLELEGNAMHKLVQEIVHPERLERFKEIALSTILFTLASLNYGDNSKIEIIVDVILDAKRLPKFLEESLATMCYSLKKLGWKDMERLNPLFDEISSRLDKNSIKGLALCNIVCGLSHMGCTHEGFWKSAVRTVSTKGIISQLTQKGLTGLFCGFLTAGVCEEEVYWTIIEEFVRSERLKNSSEEDLANFLCSISLMKNPDVKSAEILLREVGVKALHLSDRGISSVLLSLEKMGFSNKGDISPIMESATESARLKNCSEDYLAAISYSLAGLNVRSIGNSWVDNVFDEISKERRLHNFSIDNIAQIVYTLGKIKRGEELAVRMVFEAADRGLENCSHHILSNIIFGLGGLSFPKSTSIVFLIEESLKPDRINGFSMHTVVTILLGLAKLNAWKDRHLELTPIFDTIKQQSDSIRPTDISKILHCLACINCQDLDLVEILAEKFAYSEEALGTCDEKTLSTVMHSLSQLKFCKSSVWELLWKEVSQEERMSKFSNEGLSNILSCCLQVANSDSQGSGGLGKHLVENLVSPSRLSNAHEVTLIKTLECMVATEECSPSNLQSIVTEISQPERAHRFGTSDRVRIVRAFAKIRTGNNHTIMAMNKFLDTLSLANLLLFSIDYLVELVECANSLPNPSAKLVHSLKEVVGIRRNRLGRRTVMNVVEMMGKVNTQQSVPQ